MPRSRSKRSSYRPPPQAKPKRSPRWLPFLGLGLIVGGMLVVVVGFLVEMPLAGLGLGILLGSGFVLMAAGLVVLSRVH